MKKKLGSEPRKRNASAALSEGDEKEAFRIPPRRLACVIVLIKKIIIQSKYIKQFTFTQELVSKKIRKYKMKSNLT